LSPELGPRRVALVVVVTRRDALIEAATVTHDTNRTTGFAGGLRWASVRNPHLLGRYMSLYQLSFIGGRRCRRRQRRRDAPRDGGGGDRAPMSPATASQSQRRARPCHASPGPRLARTPAAPR